MRDVTEKVAHIRCYADQFLLSDAFSEKFVVEDGVKDDSVAPLAVDFTLASEPISPKRSKEVVGLTHEQYPSSL